MEHKKRTLRRWTMVPMRTATKDYIAYEMYVYDPQNSSLLTYTNLGTGFRLQPAEKDIANLWRIAENADCWFLQNMRTLCEDGAIDAFLMRETFLKFFQL